MRPNHFYFIRLQPDDFEEEEEEIIRKPSSLAELKRKQTTAVVLLGVIGAEFGQDISTDGNFIFIFLYIKMAYNVV